jgi:hypothetical protein
VLGTLLLTLALLLGITTWAPQFMWDLLPKLWDLHEFLLIEDCV